MSGGIRIKTLTTALALVFLAPLALATHDAGCVPEVATYGWTVYTNPAGVEGSPGYYVNFELYQPGPLFGLWIYEESNGLAGLQRGDEVFFHENCGHGPDTLIF